MAKCFSCGGGFSEGVHGVLRHKKELYDEGKEDCYFYKLSTKGNIFTVKKKGFKSIFEQLIQPNFHNGANYAHISEYGKSDIL